MKLPEVWQKRIISCEITATQARDELLRWVDVPGLLEKVAKKNKGDLRDSNLDWMVETAACEISRDMRTDEYLGDKRRLFKVSKDVEKELDVRKVRHYMRAFNVALFDRLQAEARAAAAKQADKKEVAAGAKAKKETAAERRAKEKAAAETFGKHLYRWKTAWLQGLLAERMPKAGDGTILKLLLHFTVAAGHNRDEGLEQAIKTHGGKVKSLHSWMRTAFWPSLKSLDAPQLWKIARSAFMAWVQEPFEGWHCHITPEQIEDLAKELGVNVKKEWKLTEEFLELHTKGQLIALTEEWGWESPAESSKRSEVIELILGMPAPNCPKEVLELKPVELR